MLKLDANLFTAIIGVVGTIVGGIIGYYSGAHKDNATLVIELTRNVTTIDDKAKTIDLLISRGLLTGVSANTVNDILEKNAFIKSETVPSGLVCGGIWCSLRGQIINIKKFYISAGYFDGPLNDEVLLDFTNATINYQTKKMIPVDGIIGARTFELIRKDAEALGVSFK